MLLLSNSYKLSLKLNFNLFLFFYASGSGKNKRDSNQTGWSISRVFYVEIPNKLAGGW